MADKPYPGGRGEIGVESTSGGCEYEDLFLNELLGLPPYRDIDFTIELHISTSLISMTPRRMAPTKLQELKVQVQELLNEGRRETLHGSRFGYGHH